MTALLKDRDTPFRDGKSFRFPIAEAILAYAGGLAAINSSGYCTKASATTGLNIRGIFESQVDNSAGANGALNADVKTGIFKLINSGVNPITDAHIGTACYAEDDVTVGSSPTGKSVAGIVVQVDSDGVWVDVGRLPYPAEHDSYLAEVTITTAQLLALNATPVELVAAPGAGKANVLEEATFYKAAGTAYDGIASGEDLSVKYTNGSGAEVAQVETTGFLDQATAQVRHAKAAVAAVAPVANAALVAHLLVGEIATGDSDLKVRVRYRIIDTSW